jgi:hypothetical protein
MSQHGPESVDPCICPPEGPCLGAESDTGTRIECTACLALDPEAQCLHDCDGSSECFSVLHIHGCYADRDGARCDDPDDHAQVSSPPVGSDTPGGGAA